MTPHRTSGRRLFLAAVVLVAASCLGVSSAEAHHSPVELALKDAGAYWHVTPPCSTVVFVALPGTMGGRAGCPIEITATLKPEQVTNWPEFCKLVTHEVGHLALGLTYFATTNPTDPAHSSDPTSIMFADWEPAYPATCFPASFPFPRGFMRWTVRHGRLTTSGRDGHTIESTEGGAPVTLATAG